MPVNSSSPAWRTKPCKFFAEKGTCSKGADCRFSHIDAQGNDHHEFFDQFGIDSDIDHEQQNQVALQANFEEEDRDSVEEKEESCDEEGRFRYHPHFGIYEGFGP